MPRFVPPHRTDPAATRAGTAKHICFWSFPQSCLLALNLRPPGVNSNPRRTCNTRILRKPACTFSIPASANIPGNTGTDLPALLPLLSPPFFPSSAVQQQPGPALLPEQSPAFRPVSRPHGYSTSPHWGESASAPTAAVPVTYAASNTLRASKANSRQILRNRSTIFTCLPRRIVSISHALCYPRQPCVYSQP